VQLVEEDEVTPVGQEELEDVLSSVACWSEATLKFNTLS
jgi:hypothetical protein